ncbi:Calx-beta domain-containing protein, partial [Ancylomarina sp. YFZ004]
ANITDDESVSAALSVSNQGNEDAPTDIVYTVTLSSPNNTGSPITFDIDDAGTGTASSGVDYTAIASGATITVANGSSTGTFTVAVIDDGLLETTETVIATISNSSNGDVSISTASAAASITDDESVSAALSVSTQGNEDAPTDIVYTVTLSSPNNTGS